MYLKNKLLLFAGLNLITGGLFLNASEDKKKIEEKIKKDAEEACQKCLENENLRNFYKNYIYKNSNDTNGLNIIFDEQPTDIIFTCAREEMNSHKKSYSQKASAEEQKNIEKSILDHVNKTLTEELKSSQGKEKLEIIKSSLIKDKAELISGYNDYANRYPLVAFVPPALKWSKSYLMNISFYDYGQIIGRWHYLFYILGKWNPKIK